MLCGLVLRKDKCLAQKETLEHTLVVCMNSALPTLNRRSCRIPSVAMNTSAECQARERQHRVLTCGSDAIWYGSMTTQHRCWLSTWQVSFLYLPVYTCDIRSVLGASILCISCHGFQASSLAISTLLPFLLLFTACVLYTPVHIHIQIYTTRSICGLLGARL